MLYVAAGCAEHDAAPRQREQSAPGATKYAVSIVTPDVLRGLPIGDPDLSGRPTVTPCSTCHGEEDKSALPEDAGSLAGPHTGLSVAHGTLRCAACHEPTRRDLLRLADGRSVPVAFAMELCAQCHGPQKRDFDHGAHGGMRGFWDLTRGPRERNHCVSCHDPHAPNFGKFAPVPGPRDRSVSAKAGTHE